MYIAYAIITCHQPRHPYCQIHYTVYRSTFMIYLRMKRMDVNAHTHVEGMSVSCGERSNTVLIPRLCFVSKSLSSLLMAHCRILSVLLLLPLSLSFQSISPSPFLSVFMGNLFNARLHFSVSNPCELPMEAFLGIADVLSK